MMRLFLISSIFWLCGVLTAATIVQAPDTVVSTSFNDQFFADINDMEDCQKHEFSTWTSGGISALNYKPTFGNRDWGLGGTFGMGYTFYFHKNWGIHTGLEIALYNTTYHLKKLKDMYTRFGFDDLTPGWTGENEIIDYHTELSNYTERQQLYNLSIPLMLQFQVPFYNEKHLFYALAGTKISTPIQNTYQSNATLYTWYYDYKTNQEFRPDPTNYGLPYLEDLGCFYNFPYSTGQQKNTFKIAGLATAEMGVKWELNSKLSLYTGVYVDYGFTNMSKHSGKRFFEFDAENAEMISNSILTSQYAHNGNPVANFTDKISPLAFGIKIRVGINRCTVERKIPQTSEKIHKIFYPCYNPCCCPSKPEPQNAIDSLPKNKTFYVQTKPSHNFSDPLLTAEIKRATAEYGELKDALMLQSDGYKVDQTYLSPIMKTMIDDKLKLLEPYNNGKYIIIIEGHTCDLGQANYNLSLGYSRALVVQEYLISKGFRHSNIITTSKGKTSPVVQNIDERNRKINRRVMLFIKEKEN